MTESQQSRVREGSPRWRFAIVLGLAGLFYAYAVWNAVAQLLTLAVTGLTMLGWVTLLFGVVFPAIVFVLGYLIGRRLPVGHLVIVFLAGLGIVAVFGLSMLDYSVRNMSDLVTGSI